MTIPWITRLPTPEEVRAHAEAHRAAWFPDLEDGWGCWMACDGIPTYHLLSAGDSAVYLYDGDMLTERRMPGTRWLACTAEGIPVCLLPAADTGDPTPLRTLEEYRHIQCMSRADGGCAWPECPQRRDGEPGKTGRTCPLLEAPTLGELALEQIKRGEASGEVGCCDHCYDSHGWCLEHGSCDCHTKHGRAVT